MPGNTDRTDCSIPQMITSSMVLFILAAIYFYGMAIGARQSVWFELLISIILPLFLFFSGWLRYLRSRLVQLIIIESLFNIIVVLNKFTIIYTVNISPLIFSSGFAVFFILQILGFTVNRLKKRLWLDLIQIAVLSTAIFFWFFNIDNTATVIDHDNRFLMWGQNTPLLVQLIYFFWILHAVLVDSSHIPKLNFAVATLSSVAVSMCMGEFFHVRLLTACHLFFLEALFGYNRAGTFGEAFCSIPKKRINFYNEKLRPFIGLACTVLCCVFLFFYIYSSIGN